MQDDIKIFKLKKLLKYLKHSTGNGTSMISLIIPPKDQIHRISRMLTDEYGTASNIKSRVNRLSVLSAITSAQTKLKSYKETPPNGLGIFVGTVVNDQNKEKKISVGIEPIKPINTSLYMCDSKFHVDELLQLFEDDFKYGFVVIDGHSSLFATLQGNVKSVLQQIHVDLPKKHGRGGQSSVRFARLRVEKRYAYVKKVAEIISNLFLSNNVLNVEGVILAGQSDLKNELVKCLDQRIKVIKTVDTNYGGEMGLNQAIELCEDVLKDVKLSKEKKVLQDFFYEIGMDTGKYCFSFKETLYCLELGAVDTLIVYEEFSGGREFKECDNASNGYSSCNVDGNSCNLDGNNNSINNNNINNINNNINNSNNINNNFNNNNTQQEESFVDWIAENYKDYGCKLVFVSDKSSEGTQFVEGFGGIGGILRYKVDLNTEYEGDYSSVEDDDIF